MAQIPNPRKQFSFSIQIAPLPINAFLAQKVTIPDININTAKHGDTNHDINTAGRVTYSNIVIEKLMTTGGADNYMFDWLASCQDVIIGGGNIPTAYKRILTISELAEDGTSIINEWLCTGCFPASIKGIELDRMSSENTMERIELYVDQVEKL